MAQPDDIDKLLREIEAMNQPQPAAGREVDVPAKGEVSAGGSSGAPVAKPDGGRGARLAWTGAGAVGGLVTGGVVGTVLTFLPWVSTMSTAVGAAVGGAVLALVSGPPRWFDDGE
jgi:hypothetical protein